MGKRLFTIALVFSASATFGQDEPGEGDVEALVGVAEAEEAGQAEQAPEPSREELVAMLDSAAYKDRQQAESRLLIDNTLSSDALKRFIAASDSAEQRNRLIRIAEHHVLREIREKEFGANPLKRVEEDQPFDPFLGQRRSTAAVGFSYAPLLADENPFTDQLGVTVVATMPGFPGHAYLRPGDIIVEIDGQGLTRGNHHQDITAWISWRIASHQPGSKIALGVLREGEPMDFVIVTAQSSALEAMYSTDGLKAAARSAKYDRMWKDRLEELTEGLAEPETLSP